MNPLQTIRARLGVTQAALAKALGVSQGNISHYEKGQEVPPPIAKLLIEFAAGLGHVVTYVQIYGEPAGAIQPPARRATDPEPPAAPARPFRKPPGRKGVMELQGLDGSRHHASVPVDGAALADDAPDAP